MLDCALRYAERWSVFPCKPGEKVPACEHGCKDATRDRDRIRSWWTSMPEANIGVATGAVSGIFVLDVDGEEGMESLLDLGHGIPATLTQHTPSGGLHFIFAYPTEVGNSARKIGPNLDTRGDGGYIVVAPSLHPNGGRYRWAGKGEPRTVPGWLLRLVRPAPERRDPVKPAETKNLEGYVRSAVEGERDAVVTAMEGSRNHTLNAAAFSLGTLVGAGTLNSETVYDVLLGAAREAGLTEREARRTIASGLSSGVKHPRRDVA